jgi:hypothetical protein
MSLIIIKLMMWSKNFVNEFIGPMYRPQKNTQLPKIKELELDDDEPFIHQCKFLAMYH